MRVSDDEQGINKLWPKVKGRGGTVNKRVFMQKKPSEGFFKDGVMRNFWNLFFDKVKLYRSVTSLKTSLVQVFSCEFCEICKNTFFAEHHQTTTSDYTVFSPITDTLKADTSD